MDLFHHDTPDAETPQFVAFLPAAAQQALQNIDDADELRQRLHEAHNEFVNVLRNAHRAQFPLTDNLMSLVFLVQADLNETQRERFVTSMSLRQIDMAQYTYLQVKQLFMELFCTTRTGIADPTIRHAKRSTFLDTEEGECDGEQGYWWSKKKPAMRALSASLLKMISGCLAQKEATGEDAFLIEDLNKEKEKAVEANRRDDLDFDQGLRKARAT